MVARWEGGRRMGEKGEGIKYKLVVTEQSQRCKVQHREYNSKRIYMHDPWTWTMVWGLTEGVTGLGGGGTGGITGTTIIA